MLKVHRRSERDWRSTAPLNEFQSIARSSVGKDRPGKAEDDWCKQLWGGVPSPGVRTQERTREREELWAERLELTEEKVGRGKRKREQKRDASEKAKRARPKQEQQNVNRPRVELDGAKVAETGEARANSSDAPKTPTSVRVFESVTNLALPTPPSPLAQKTRTEITVLPLATPRLDSRARSSNAAHQLVRAPPGPTTPNHRRHAEDEPPGAPSTPSPRAVISPTPQGIVVPPLRTPTPRYEDTPFGRFLSRSAIWIPPSFSPPTNVPGCTRVDLRDIVPPANRAFSLDALLLACRWPSPSCPAPASTWAERGVVFIEDGDLSMQMPVNTAPADSTCLCRWTQDNPLGRLIARRSAMLGSIPEGGKTVSIWVFKASVLAVEWLEGVHNVNRHSTSVTTQEEDLAAKAILKIG